MAYTTITLFYTPSILICLPLFHCLSACLHPLSLLPSLLLNITSLNTPQLTAAFVVVFLMLHSTTIKANDYSWKCHPLVIRKIKSKLMFIHCKMPFWQRLPTHYALCFFLHILVLCLWYTLVFLQDGLLCSIAEQIAQSVGCRLNLLMTVCGVNIPLLHFLHS